MPLKKKIRVLADNVWGSMYIIFTTVAVGADLIDRLIDEVQLAYLMALFEISNVFIFK